MLSHSLREDLNMEIESEDLIGRDSEFQSEQVLGTNEFRCSIVHPLEQSTADNLSVLQW